MGKKSSESGFAGFTDMQENYLSSWMLKRKNLESYPVHPEILQILIQTILQ